MSEDGGRGGERVEVGSIIQDTSQAPSGSGRGQAELSGRVPPLRQSVKGATDQARGRGKGRGKG